MSTFVRFFYEFISIIFNGIKEIFNGIVKGFKIILSPKDYLYLINNYSEEFNGPEWVFVVFTIIVLLVVVGLIVFILVFLIRKYLKFRKSVVKEEEMLEEIVNLNQEVANLVKENDRIMAMKVSQLGIKPEEEQIKEETESQDEENEIDGEFADRRFPQLSMVDAKNVKTKKQDFNNSQPLDQLIDDFRCFAASKLHLYYDMSLLRVFFAGLACGKMIILQGISGTGKTSLAYAWSKFNKLNPCVSSVQPSWRDRSDFFGYLNDFTKRFNETDALVEIYRALYDDRIHTVILDEMNLARVEYYFAEVLSILECRRRRSS